MVGRRYMLMEVSIHMKPRQGTCPIVLVRLQQGANSIP